LEIEYFKENAKTIENTRMLQQDNTTFLQPIDSYKPTTVGILKIPKCLKRYKKVAIWEIGPAGKFIIIGRMRIKV